MYLRSLTLKGFKSFARKTVLEFEPGVSIIVGPNGSGKSNIADAVLWALGEQSPTSLRGNRMEDIIFAGSSGHKPVGMAEVALTLDNSQSDFPVDYSEVTITRNVLRGGDSEYRLNNASCRLLDIQEMLSDAGVGRNLNAVISQGQLDDVLSCRPEERREYIEEAGGLLKYRRRREKAVRRLTRMDEELVRISDVLREVKRQLRPLVQQADRLEKYKFLNKELSEAKLRLDVGRLRSIQKEWQGHEDVQQERSTRLADIEQRLSERTKLVVELEGREESWRLREAELRDQLYRLVSVHEQLKALFPVWSERQRAAGEASPVDPAIMRTLRESNSELAQRAAELNDNLEEMSERESGLARRIEEANSRLSTLTRDIARIEAQIEVARPVSEVAEPDMGEWIRSREKESSDLAGERDRLRGSLRELEERREQIQKRISSLEETALELRRWMADMFEGRVDAESRRSYLTAWQEILNRLGGGDWRGSENASEIEICDAASGDVGRALEECSRVVEAINFDIASCRSAESQAAGQMAAMRQELESVTGQLSHQAETIANREGRLETILEDISYWSERNGETGIPRIDVEKAEMRLSELREDDRLTRAEHEEASGLRTELLVEMKAAESEKAGVERELDLGRKNEAKLQGDSEWLGMSHDKTTRVIESLRDAHEHLIEGVQKKREWARRELEEGSKLMDEAAGEIRILRDGIIEEQRKHDELREQMHGEDLSRTELKLRVEQLVESVVDDHKVPLEFALNQYPDESPDPELEQKVGELSRRLEHIGPVNPEALTERETLEERYNFLREQIDDVENAKTQLRKVVREVDQRIVQKFRETAEEVDRNFQDIFSSLFPNGRAEIKLTQPDDLLNTGIEIYAQPEGKRLQRISLLSGGETALTALAFFFALFRVRPSPFYFLDEVEAALDDINLHRFLDLVRQFKDDSQLILITHQKRSMEIADILYGITMHDDGVSRVVSQRVAS